MARTPQSARAGTHRTSPTMGGIGLGRPASHRVAPNPPQQSKRDLYPSADLVAINRDGTVTQAGAASRSLGHSGLAGEGGVGLLAAMRQAPKRPSAALERAVKEPFSAWQGDGDAAPEPPTEPGKQVGAAGSPSGLAARLSLAAAASGVGKGLKSLADIAKPTIKGKGALKTLLTRTPLDIALADAAKARKDAKTSMASGEINLNKLYARDHDGMVTARGLLVGSNNAMNKLMAATEALETQADAARTKLIDDAAALRDASCQSIDHLTAHREMLTATLLAELSHIENNSELSLKMLLAANQKGEKNYAILEYKRQDEVERLTAELREERAGHKATTAAAEKAEARLSAEVARLCGVVEQMKAAMQQQAKEASDAHALLSRNMSNALADKQRTLDERDVRLAELEEQLHGTSATLNGRLRDLAREKAEREARLEQEKQELAESGRKAAMELDQRLSMLKVEKEHQERSLSDELQKTQQESAKQADSLRTKIEKMRKLQVRRAAREVPA